mgnify:CR=1 FL=1
MSKSTCYTLQEKNFHWNLNFAMSLMPNSLVLNFAYYNIIIKLSMADNIKKFQKSRLANSLFYEFDQSDPGR